MLAVIHNLADYWIAISNDLHQVKRCRLRLSKCITQANNTDLFTFCIDQANLFGFDLIVDPRFLRIAFGRGSVISFDSCISNKLIETNLFHFMRVGNQNLCFRQKYFCLDALYRRSSAR